MLELATETRPQDGGTQIELSNRKRKEDKGEGASSPTPKTEGNRRKQETNTDLIDLNDIEKTLIKTMQAD